VFEDGLVSDEGTIGVTAEALRGWADGLRADDQVALEATGNSDAIANLLTRLVGRVVVCKPSRTRAIAEAKVKTDKVDARILAQLLAAGFVPPVWLPGERTRSLRRQVMRRAHLVSQRTRIKKPGLRDPGPHPGSDPAGVGPVRQDRAALPLTARASRRRAGYGGRAAAPARHEESLRSACATASTRT
jgi:hypothetical protein